MKKSLLIVSLFVSLFLFGCSEEKVGEVKENKQLISYSTGMSVANNSDISDTEFHKKVLETYNFNVCDIPPQEELEKRSNQLDSFWKLVESNTGKYLPLLIQELKNT